MAKLEVKPEQQLMVSDESSSSPNEAHPGTTSSGKSFGKSIWHTWLWECLGVLAALASLIGIWVILDKYDGLALPDFPYSITLNTIVSLLTQAYTIGVGLAITEIISQARWNWFSTTHRPLIDFKTISDATGGPLGAAQLFLTPRLILHSLAAPAALLTIAVLAVGPFTQQLVQTEPRDIVRGVATVPRSDLYNAYTAEGANMVALKQIDLTFKASFYNGLYGSADPSRWVAKPTCPTGNCTWPAFSSLGMCNQCVDLTSSLKSDCTGEGIAKMCTFTLPSNFSISLSAAFATFINVSTIRDPIPSLPRYKSTVTQIQIISNRGQSPQSPAAAYGCGLYLCVKTYNDTVESGVHAERIQSAFPNATTSAADISDKITGGDVATRADLVFKTAQRDGIEGGPYTVEIQTFRAMGDFLSAGLSGGAHMLSGRSEIFHSDAIQALWNAVKSNATNLEAVMSSVATSLTSTIRTNPNSRGSTTMEGTASRTETFVMISWVWITGPAVFLVLVILLLIGIIWQTARGDIGAFKSDSMATLFVGLDQTKRDAMGVLQNVEDMESVAKRTRVRLERDDVDGQYRLM